MAESRDDPGSEDGIPVSRVQVQQEERPRAGKKGRRRSRTIATKKLTRDELALGQELDTLGYDRPLNRVDCVDGPRPCPFVSCKHHLYLDVNPETGSIKLNFPNLEVWEMEVTCALDVAERGGITLEEVGEILNLTRERIRQVEVKGLQKLREVASELGLEDFLSFIERNLSAD